MLGCQETVRKIADKFDISEYSVISVRDRFLKAVIMLKDDIIKRPKVILLKKLLSHTTGIDNRKDIYPSSM